MGHQANFLKEPSPEGFTHSWTVFVRGFEGSLLDYFVEKVVFRLHKTFKSPVRVITEPPFQVTECGYAGFILPVEIYFKNKQTPRKIVFEYDLFLNAVNSPPINNVRYEKLKFQNPTPEFKAKLIKAGGIEQGLEHPSSDLFGSRVTSGEKSLPKIPKDKENNKENLKKNKKSSPQLKSASPAPSLSSLSPMSSDHDDSYTASLAPPPVKKETELPVKKESSSSQPKQDSSSSHKDKSKHRSSSSNSSLKDRLEKHSHKDKTKGRDHSRSQRDNEAVKKDRDSNSKKVKETFESRMEREGSHSSGKSSTSSSQLDKVAVQTSHEEKGKSLKDKDALRSSKEKLGSNKDGEQSSKEKHSFLKHVSHTSHSESKKVLEDLREKKMPKENDRHNKIQKKHTEGKEPKSSSSDKNKREMSHKSEKQRHSHSSETKKKEYSAKHSQKHEVVNTSESPTHLERQTVTADFQPWLKSPLKSKSHAEESPTTSPHPDEKPELKRSTSHSSPDSRASGRTPGYAGSQQKDLKSVLNKQSQSTTQITKISLQKEARRVSAEDIKEKAEFESTRDTTKYFSNAEKKANTTKPSKSKRVKRKKEYSDSGLKQADVTNIYTGLDMLAPNGISLGELIAINEQIEKSQANSNHKLLERIAEVIAETDDYDISDVSLSFDICSLDKTVVRRIEALLNELLT
ncbi:hypothetical protein BsWGS_00529 [Bradybaena similaris]